MPVSPQDELHLQRALYLARQAVGLASPNPAVGCVIANADRLLGEGAHYYDRRDHAEIVALKDVAVRGHSAHGATAFVTLEPCSHHGRTPPCADALIAANIARCVVATVDPNPQVSGAGIERMRQAGIIVDVLPPSSPLSATARDLNDAFAFSIQHGRPFVTLKAAVSVDGKLAPAPSQRAGASPHWLTGAAARADVQHLRHVNDAILVGIGTVLADDPMLTDRTALPRRRPLLRLVFDSDLRTPPESKLVRSANNDVLLLCTASASTQREAALIGKGVRVQRSTKASARIDPCEVLDTLFREDIRSLLIEAGTAINGTFLHASLVDRVVLYYSETELGVNALPFAEGIASPYILQEQLQRIQRRTFPHGSLEDVRVTGYLHDPWQSLRR